MVSGKMVPLSICVRVLPVSILLHTPLNLCALYKVAAVTGRVSFFSSGLKEQRLSPQQDLGRDNTGLLDLLITLGVTRLVDGRSIHDFGLTRGGSARGCLMIGVSVRSWLSVFVFESSGLGLGGSCFFAGDGDLITTHRVGGGDLAAVQCIGGGDLAVIQSVLETAPILD